MKLHFDPNQQFQLSAVESIVTVFEGQPLRRGTFDISLTEDLIHEAGTGNRLVLSEEQILKNVQAVQKNNRLTISKKLVGMNFSVEMETGTGKTYVYLRTIYELNKKYGFRKFVIVVPSIAIREGVWKNLEITHEHFQNLYDKTPFKSNVYDSRKISILRSFAMSNSIHVLVINIDSFAKDQNVINRMHETGLRPIELIRATRPIVIVDEPQNMETDIRKNAITNLNPLCTLRYSATHTEQYNMVYSLDPVKAYDLGLVKQIEVDSVVTENDFNEAYLKLEKIIAGKTAPSVKMQIDINTNEGVKRKTVTAKVGNDIFDLSGGRDLYKNGYVINEIDAGEGFIELSSGKTVFKDDVLGGLTEEVIKIQIKKTIEEHFLKELKYKEKGIKVLSLFFIDRVANYRAYGLDGKSEKGKYALWFEESYREVSTKERFKGLIPFKAGEVHNGYFSQDKKGFWNDTRGNTQADDDTFKLIMRDKERLMDSVEPLRFIFSHSALREGWDNPNVFQICTLNETKSELKKRQEIGRGLRLCVDKNGNRIHDTTINRLTVIANEAYEDFARQLQTEIEEDCSVSFAGRIKNKQKRVTVKYRKGFQVDEMFKDIWKRISTRTVYKVDYDTDKLIKAAAQAVARMEPIKKAVIKTTKTTLSFDENGIKTEIKASSAVGLDGFFAIPDVLFYIQERTGLTRATIYEILINSDRTGDILKNPQLFLDNASTTINEVLIDLMIEGIKYEKVGDKTYEMRLFEEYDIHINDLTFHIKKKEKTIYSDIFPLDSNVEYSFAHECETRDDIEFYFKLPRWFKIQTPIGPYNPDWALIKKNEKTVYFVAETKSADQELRTSEKRKIQCGKAHFEEFDDVKYRQVVKVSELE